MSRISRCFVLLVAWQLSACAVKVPAVPRLEINIRTDVRGHGRGGIEARAGVEARAGIEATAGVEVTGDVQVSGGVAVTGDVAATGSVEVTGDTAPVPLHGATVPEFFGIPLEGAHDIIFVLDRSGSMDEFAQGQLAAIRTASTAAAPRKFEVAKHELTDALNRITEGTRLNIVFFNDTLEASSAGLVPLDASSKDAALSFLSTVAPSGATALGPALRVAFLMNPRRIVLLSDGLGNVGATTASILRDAREAIRGGVRIDTIGIGDDQDRRLLETLAADSGGLYQAF